MVSTYQIQEKYNKIRKNFCFYLDIQEPAMSRCISQRLLDMGLREEVFLTSRVTHVVADRLRVETPKWPRREGRARADAMLQRLNVHSPQKPSGHHHYIQLTVQKAICLLDKLYDTFFVAPRKAHVNYFNKHFIKIEFLDKPCKPVFKEFDEWPQISLEPNPPKEKKEKKHCPEPNVIPSNNNNSQKMTRKSRPRIKEKEIKDEKGGYCEMCNVDYADASLHRRSPHHLAFVRDHTNFLALDSLINSGADVNAFLDKAIPVNGERRSMRKLCNGDVELKSKRSKRSQSPDTIDSNTSPKRNGIDEEKKHNTRCSKKSSDSTPSEDRQYYKVVGVSTKLRSSGGFIKKKEAVCNGAKPLVVKFRKVRRSELSVLSDEAEQFMFPKRASSSDSSSSDDEKLVDNRKKKKVQSPPPFTNERQRLARPLALKEESSEEDSWVEDKRKYRKRRAPLVVKRARRPQPKVTHPETPLEPELPIESRSNEPPSIVEPPPKRLEPTPIPVDEVPPLQEEVKEKCLKWEDGKLKYTPAVEQLEFAFESIPHSEPWFESFKRQDEDKVVARNVSNYFALYTKSPKLPYEIGQLPSLKPNCCPLSDLVKQREEKPGPSRSYGTRGMKKQRMRKRTAAVIALENHPRKSPREHASTLAILGSAGLLHRRKNIVDDSKSTASEDTVIDATVTSKTEPVPSENLEASERLQQFLSEVFDDASDYDVSDDLIDSLDSSVIPSKAVLDVSSLMSECENCDLIRNEIKQGTVARGRGRRGKFKKKNKTGWPTKKNKKKGSRTSSVECETKTDDSLTQTDGRSSIETDDDTISEGDQTLSETEITLTEDKESKIDSNTDTQNSDSQENRSPVSSVPMDIEEDKAENDKHVLEEKCNEQKSKESDSSKRTSSESDDKDGKYCKKKRALQGLCDWLPVVRVARVDPNVGRRLRSAGRARSNRFR